ETPESPKQVRRIRRSAMQVPFRLSCCGRRVFPSKTTGLLADSGRNPVKSRLYLGGAGLYLVATTRLSYFDPVRGATRRGVGSVGPRIYAYPGLCQCGIRPSQAKRDSALSAIL